MASTTHPRATVSFRTPSVEALVQLGVAGLSAGLALRHTIPDALWQDEVASARIIAQPTLPAALHQIQQTESTPPLWYLVAWVLHHAGIGIVGVRLLSVLAMATAAALVVQLARRVVALRYAAVAGLLVAIGSQFAEHAHELRAYALLVLLVVLFALVLEAQVRAPSAWRYVPLALLPFAGLLTHYFFALTLASAIAWLWLDPSAAHVRAKASVVVLAGAAMASPFLPLALRQYHHHRFWWIGGFALHEVVNGPFRLFSPVGAKRVGEIVPALALAGLAIGAFALARRGWSGRLVAVLAFGPWLAASLAWRAGLDIFATRNLLAAGPFFAIAAAAAIASVPRSVATFATATVVVAALAGYAWSQRLPPTPFDRIAHTLIDEGWRRNDPIEVAGNFFAFRSPLEWYLPGRPALARGVPTGKPCRTLFAVDAPTAGTFAVARLSNVRPGAGRVVLTDPATNIGCARPVTSGRFAAD